ncbi:MAG: hypothetical protein RR842_09985 [Gordonibacter sp.]|uniref:hypothetical protein n=1 Tax=Gordonibacter sp. TaxID=1968902 RepID=UPI002FC6130C
MTFAIVLVITAAASLLLRNPLRKWPWLFYVLAVAVDVLFLAESFMPRSVWSLLLTLVQKCMLPLALFAVVMFIGVFARDSKVGSWLRPVRAELSIIAWILSLGHMTVYLMSYVPRVLAGGSLGGNVALSFVVALVLFALLLMLGITSFNGVKKRMKADSWKRVQLLAYPFFGLIYVHVLLMLLPSALHGGVAAQVSVAVYTMVFGTYAVLRVARAMKDRKI